MPSIEMGETDAANRQPVALDNKVALDVELGKAIGQILREGVVGKNWQRKRPPGHHLWIGLPSHQQVSIVGSHRPHDDITLGQHWDPCPPRSGLTAFRPPLYFEARASEAGPAASPGYWETHTY